MRARHVQTLELMYRLKLLAARWDQRRLRRQVLLLREKNRALAEEIHIMRLKHQGIKQYRKWYMEILAKKRILVPLCNKYIRTNDPEVARRFNLIQGYVSYVKMKAMFGKQFPRDMWPQHIPYMDMMAWVDWRREWRIEVKRRLEQDDEAVPLEERGSEDGGETE
jgi:hypothetical protein